MSWIYELYRTYENSFGKKDIQNIRESKPLLPPFHTLQNSHIEVIIDGFGNFLDANFISDKKEQEIIIPCTEKSASRTSGEEPHPLCDKIQYCAKDYRGPKRSYFNTYFTLIESWFRYDSLNTFLNAIYQYVKKGTLSADIISTGKVFGKPEQEFGDFLVRWKVESPGLSENRCWENLGLFESWRNFSEVQEGIENICMVTGKRKTIAINHPKRIRNSGDGARLISANDKSGFTFLGRFLLDHFKNEKISVQAASVSVEVSQKAHSALRWLIDRQSFRNGDQVIVSWAVSGEETPDPFSDSFSIFEDTEEEKIKELTKTNYYDAGQTFARKLSKKIAGYKTGLGNTDKIIVMGLDSSGPGRISIIYYRELTGSDFLARIENWHIHMAWHFHEFIQAPDNKKRKFSGYFVMAPSPRVIAEACYGKRLDEKFKKSAIERIIPCIIDGRQVPQDFVDLAIKRASNKIGLEHWDWERTLSVACALYSCYSLRQLKYTNKKEKIMALENERTDRDYLYGRLLAVAEHLEEAALYAANEKRETTAARLMQRFADFPHPTWRNIESALVPYKSRLQANRPAILYKMKNLLDEIHSKFQTGDYEKDGRLSGAYLLGYHCQRLDLAPKKNNEENESENN